MKKLVVVLAVAFSGVLNAQIDFDKFESDLKNIIDTLSTVKHTNDDDQKLLFRLPYTLFTDSVTKQEYLKRNPNLIKLSVRISPYSQINFTAWLSTIKIFDETTYNIEYFTNEMHANTFQSQSITIFNPVTDEFRCIIFRYLDGDLISIEDNLHNI